MKFKYKVVDLRTDEFSYAYTGQELDRLIRLMGRKEIDIIRDIGIEVVEFDA